MILREAFENNDYVFAQESCVIFFNGVHKYLVLLYLISIPINYRNGNDNSYFNVAWIGHDNAFIYIKIWRKKFIRRGTRAWQLFRYIFARTSSFKVISRRTVTSYNYYSTMYSNAIIREYVRNPMP